MPENSLPTVLILGAGVNGACVARELALNRVSVCVVDRFDIAFGATSKSSRLIHGGLRYLEYGDVGLVRESLVERARLLRLAPQFVHPLKLYIPVQKRFGGLMAAGLRFTRLSRSSWGASAAKTLSGDGGRGLIAVRTGLWMYDQLSRGGGLPAHSVARVGEAGPRVDAERYEWLCSYWDAQMPWPERFTLALLDDARQAAAANGVGFQVLTHHHAKLVDGAVEIRPASPDGGRAAEVLTLNPDTIINATGAWGDFTLRDLPVESKPLFGGTKGSHLITRQSRLKEALGGEAVYAEADDGRLVFILPMEDAVLVGTTDERFEQSPEQAIATEEELRYLVAMTNEVFPQVELTEQDVESHYCGVRPLPHVEEGSTASIPRGHWIESAISNGMPIDTLIGGKLTTCRALGEEVADRVLGRLNLPRIAGTRERPVPGSKGYPKAADQERYWRMVAEETGFSVEAAMACCRLTGSRAVETLKGLTAPGDRRLVAGTSFPVGFVRELVRNEWVTTLADLVERRLMLTTQRRIARETLTELAALAPTSTMSSAEQVEQTIERLRTHYGIQSTGEVGVAVD
jgi:glycerol-3-phosphate dehydrogenase